MNKNFLNIAMNFWTAWNWSLSNLSTQLLCKNNCAPQCPILKATLCIRTRIMSFNPMNKWTTSSITNSTTRLNANSRGTCSTKTRRGQAWTSRDSSMDLAASRCETRVMRTNSTPSKDSSTARALPAWRRTRPRSSAGWCTRPDTAKFKNWPTIASSRQKSSWCHRSLTNKGWTWNGSKKLHSIGGKSHTNI